MEAWRRKALRPATAGRISDFALATAQRNPARLAASPKFTRPWRGERVPLAKALNRAGLFSREPVGERVPLP
jgi:hypothetical protein